MSDTTVLCVDSDAAARESTMTALEGDDHQTVGTTSVSEATDAIDNGGIDCVVTAYELPDGTGLDVVTHVRDVTPDTPCVLFADVAPQEIRTEGREDIVVEYLPRDMPDAESSLVRLVGNVVTERSQAGYPLPRAEDERLAAISQYDRPGLDTEEAFDRLATLAKSLFGTDVAFVGLVDASEERFLACEGADWETLTREDSICTHTIMGDDVLVVENTHEDPRFADNEALDDLDIRSYAGAPLKTPRGAVIGAFCLTHSTPRSFDPDDLADLQRFADEAMEQLELRRRLSDSENEPGGDDA